MEKQDFESIDYWRKLYDIDDNGHVTSLGRFERQHWYTMVYWQYSLDGGLGEVHASMDTEGFYAELYVLQPDDYLKFPLFYRCNAVAVNIEQNNRGFIHLSWLYDYQLESIRHDIAGGEYCPTCCVPLTDDNYNPKYHECIYCTKAQM